MTAYTALAQCRAIKMEDFAEANLTAMPTSLVKATSTFSLQVSEKTSSSQWYYTHSFHIVSLKLTLVK